jgi:short-subunit dehydrogenase
VIPLILDVTVDSDIVISRKIVEKMLGESGAKLIGIVNSAGYAESGFLETSSLDSVKKVFDMNVFAQIAVTQAFLPLLRKTSHNSARSGRVIFVSSVAGVVTMPGLGAYCASRHALESINDALRMELKSWNIDVVCIESGRIGSNYVDTLDLNLKFNEMTSSSDKKYQVEEEVVQRYAKFGSQITLENKKGHYGDVSLVSNKIFKALYDSKPLNRYSCGIDAAFLLNILNITPFEMFDLILGRVTLRK